MIYDLAYKAQKESLKMRKGGKINFGIIELMIPIVTTQIIEQRNDISVLDKVEKILKIPKMSKLHIELLKNYMIMVL